MWRPSGCGAELELIHEARRPETVQSAVGRHRRPSAAPHQVFSEQDNRV